VTEDKTVEQKLKSGQTKCSFASIDNRGRSWRPEPSPQSSFMTICVQYVVVSPRPDSFDEVTTERRANHVLTFFWRDPHPDVGLKNEVRTKHNYRRLYTDRPDPIVFMILTVSVLVNTSELLYDDFLCLLFLHLSTSLFIPLIQLPRFIRSRHPSPLLTPSLVLFPPHSV
jgi:hypothetical protein